MTGPQVSKPGVGPTTGSNTAASARSRSDVSEGAELARQEPTLPKSTIVQPLSPTPQETQQQVSRLATGLFSHLGQASQRSALAAQLQLETRLLGGIAITVTNTARPQGDSGLVQAAQMLKTLSNSDKA